eukprot:PhF_6_TR22221/c0_g1_i2/m.31380
MLTRLSCFLYFTYYLFCCIQQTASTPCLDNQFVFAQTNLTAQANISQFLIDKKNFSEPCTRIVLDYSDDVTINLTTNFVVLSRTTFSLYCTSKGFTIRCPPFEPCVRTFSFSRVFIEGCSFVGKLIEDDFNFGMFYKIHNVIVDGENLVTPVGIYSRLVLPTRAQASLNNVPITHSVFVHGAQFGCLIVRFVSSVFIDSVRTSMCVWSELALFYSGGPSGHLSGGNVRVYNSVFDDGYAHGEARGGCVFILGISYTEPTVVRNVSSRNCTMEQWNGGGCMSISARYLTLTDIRIDTCVTTFGYGGCLHVSAVMVMKNVRLSNCSARLYGGCFVLFASEFQNTVIASIVNMEMDTCVGQQGCFSVSVGSQTSVALTTSNISMLNCTVRATATATAATYSRDMLDKNHGYRLNFNASNEFIRLEDFVHPVTPPPPASNTNDNNNKTSNSSSSSSSRKSNTTSDTGGTVWSRASLAVATSSTVLQVVTKIGDGAAGVRTVLAIANIESCDDRMNTTFQLSYAVYLTQMDLFSPDEMYEPYLSAAVSNAGLSIILLLVGMGVPYFTASLMRGTTPPPSSSSSAFERFSEAAGHYEYPSSFYFLHEYFDTAALPSMLLVLMNTTSSQGVLWSVLFVMPVYVLRIIFLWYCYRNAKYYCQYDDVLQSWHPLEDKRPDKVFFQCFSGVFSDFKITKMWAMFTADAYIFAFAILTGYIPTSAKECQTLQSLSIAVACIYFGTLCTFPFATIWRSVCMCFSQVVVVGALVVAMVRSSRTADGDDDDDVSTRLDVSCDVLVFLSSMIELGAVVVPTVELVKSVFLRFWKEKETPSNSLEVELSEDVPPSPTPSSVTLPPVVIL